VFIKYRQTQQRSLNVLVTGSRYATEVSDNMFRPSSGHHQVYIELDM